MSSLPTTTTAHVPTMVRPDGAAIARASQPALGGLGPRQILNMLLRHLWLMIITFLVVGVMVGGLYALCLRYKTMFTARGQMQVTEQRDIKDFGVSRSIDKTSVEMRQAEQAMSIIADDNLDAFLKTAPAQRTLWWQAHSNDKRGPLDYLKSRIKADPMRNSSRVMISVDDADPKVAAEMCTEIMSFYQDRSRSALGKEEEENMRVLNDELRTVNTNLTSLDSSLDTKRRSLDFEAMERQRVESIDRVAQLSSLQTNYVLQVDQARRAVDGVRALRNPGAPPTADILREVERDPILTNLVARQQYLVEELAVLEETKGPNHPEVINARARLQEIEDAIRAKRIKLIENEKEHVVSSAEANLDATQKLLDKINENLETARTAKQKVEKSWSDYDADMRKRESLVREKERLDGLAKEVHMRQNLGIPQLKMVGQAAVPDEISFPRWELFLIGGVFLGLCVAIGLALLIEVIDSSVRTPRDLSENVRLPLLGFVPLVQSGQMPRRELARLVMRDPISMVAESFRQIRTNLLFSAPVDQLSSIAITSAARDEGKTVVATNLAITIALSGRRVLLVDANFRRPALADVFALPGAVGLSNILTNQAQLAEAVQQTDVPNLSVVSSGPTPPNPAELLGSATMRTFLDQADAEYDLVIFDSPPALLVSDTLMLATMVDGVVAVIRASATSRGMVSRLRDQLQRVHARILGAVLNAARPTRGGYFRKSQQQYEEYHNITA